MAGVAKAFNLRFTEVIYGVSYANVVLYTSTLPTYDSEEKTDDEINMNDPKNKDRVSELINTFK